MHLDDLLGTSGPGSGSVVTVPVNQGGEGRGSDDLIRITLPIDLVTLLGAAEEDAKLRGDGDGGGDADSGPDGEGLGDGGPGSGGADDGGGDDGVNGGRDGAGATGTDADCQSTGTRGDTRSQPGTANGATFAGT